MVVEEVSPVTASSTKSPGVPQDQIDNIMGGIGNTGSVRMNNHRKRLKQSFDIIKRLGQGTYGKVQLGINKETGQEVAIKTIKKCKIEAEADLIRIRREVQIMSSVQHPNIIHIYEVFESREKLILVMEFAAGGELYDYLSERKVLSEDEARRIFRQISTAVYYCHKHKICHRDLKLENILLDEQGNAKIADFGLSNVFDDQKLLATFCGSPLYASPEIVKGIPYQGPEVDCWSLGVLLYTLVYGSMPFDGSNFKRLVKQISTGDYYEPKHPSPASPLIREMLTVCPQKRATIEQICSHWWVNEGYKESCLDLAEDLANQTPVRLDVLLSLSPAAVTAEQLVVPSSEAKTNERVQRSHSVGSIRDMNVGTTEAERRILNMVAAGGEAALMPSPTRTITPTQSPVQSKRKLETTVSTENATGAVKKRERTSPEHLKGAVAAAAVENISDEYMRDEEPTPPVPGATEMKNTSEKHVARQKTMTKLDAVKELSEEEVNPTKIIKNFVDKHKTSDLVASINKITPSIDSPIIEQQKQQWQQQQTESVDKNNLPDESVSKPSTERRRSRILETAEKFQNLNNANGDKQKKIVIPGVSVGSFKKEYERRASLTGTGKSLDKKSDSFDQSQNNSAALTSMEIDTVKDTERYREDNCGNEGLSNNDLKNITSNFSLEEARRSMENSIALLNQAKDETTKEVEQLCAKTENVSVSESIANAEREKKLKNAREIIGNAIQPGGRLCMGARKPPVPYGLNGRSISGSVVPPSNTAEKLITRTLSLTSDKEEKIPKADSPPSQQQPQKQGTVKTSKAEITLKSATLPRRKTAKTEIQLDIKPKIPEQSPMRFSTEIQHEMPDLRSAPVRDAQQVYSPLSPSFHQRATSLEPQGREHFIPIQKPSVYTRNNSNTIRSGSSSRQSTIESEGEVTTPSTTVTSSSQYTLPSQPIKKSPREFIIPIAVEGGGFVTPRSGSLEPSESNHTTINSTFSHIGKPKRIGLLSEIDSEEESPFQKIRMMNKDSHEDPRFTLHRLRSTRPVKKLSQDTNDSQSSGEDDDEDGFEILTAENLFSTLLQRVRALTNRLNVNNDIGSGFSNSRLLENMRTQPRSSFWNNDPFRSRLGSNTGNTNSSTWRQNLGTDMDSMFSRSNTALPRGKSKSKNRKTIPNKENNIIEVVKDEGGEAFDLADLDLSRLRLTKKDLETLSTITPGLPKCFQEQLLAKLPPTQARKLSRTLSMQNNSLVVPTNTYKRSISGGHEIGTQKCETSFPPASSLKDDSLQQQQQEKTVENSRGNSADGNNRVYKKSSSRDRFDETDSMSGSGGCRSSSECNKSFCVPYLTEVSDKYKYYSPYVNKTDRQMSPQKRYEYISTRSPCLNSSKDVCGRPPSGCTSPPLTNTETLHQKRSSKKRLLKYSRPDMSDMSSEGADNSCYRDKVRERETQSMLREIRGKIDGKEEKRCRSVEKTAIRKPCDHLIDNNKIFFGCEKKTNSHHVRNKSLDNFCDFSERDNNVVEKRRRSFSRPAEMNENDMNYMHKCAIANQILEELQILAAVRVGRSSEKSSENTETDKIKTKKSQTKEKLNNKFENQVEEITLKLPKIKKEKKSGVKTNSSNENVKPDTDSLESNKKNSDNLENSKKVKKESKLLRPKSYPNKEPEKLTEGILSNDNAEANIDKSPESTKSNGKHPKETGIVRPKSYPNSKLIQPKEIKKFARSGPSISAVMEKLMEKSEKTFDKPFSNKKSNKQSPQKEIKIKNKTDFDDDKSEKDKKSKVSKSSETPSEVLEEPKNKSASDKNQEKSKSSEKKPSKGLLYTLGQKFEKLRENAKNKDKHSSSNKSLNNSKEQEQFDEKSSAKKMSLNNGKKSEPDSGKAQNQNTNSEKPEEKSTKSERRCKIEAMIKSLRDRSITRTPVITESGLIKRAISVEDVAGSFNKNRVNKVLGLFKKFEKDSSEKKVLNTRSTSNIEREGKNCVFNIKDRPKSSNVMNKIPTSNKETKYRENNANASANTNANVNVNKSEKENDNYLPSEIVCADCIHKKEQGSLQKNMPEFSPKYTNKNEYTLTPTSYSKEKRKGLMLDLSKLDGSSGSSSNTIGKKIDDKNSIRNYYYENMNNNNPTSSSLGIREREINKNHLLTPSIENIAYYSSDSRSPYDDCVSSSTFLSPSEEPELSFDNWSVCSEDNYTIPPPSSISCISRSSQISSPINYDNHSESVIDRIRRRSFYCRFNEKKPKRQSNIVGPAAKNFYRESRSRPPEQIESPSDDTKIRNTSDYLKSFKPNTSTTTTNSTTNYTDLKPPHVKPSSISSSSSSSRPRKSFNDIFCTSSSLYDKRYTSNDNDYLLPKTQLKDSSLYAYSSYNPKRRCSFVSKSVAPITTSTAIDGYTTLGRRYIRPYEHRSISLLDRPIHHQSSNISSSTLSSYQREQRQPTDFRNLPKSCAHYRHSSVSRSPTNM